MLDILSGIGAIELIERTSSTLRVQQVVQLSLLVWLRLSCPTAQRSCQEGLTVRPLTW